MFFAAAICAATLGPRSTVAQESQQKNVGEAQLPQNEAASVEALSNAFRTVAKHVRPAVVQIETTVAPKVEKQKGKKSTRKPQLDPRDPDSLREFLEEFGGMQPEPTPEMGSGSGVIIDAERGLILTNNHVVGGKKDKDGVRLDVILDSGRKVKATILGQDPNSDIALVKLDDIETLHSEKVPLVAIKMGDSAKMQVGDWVLAIGAPFGLAQSVTQGIISAKGRDIQGVAPVPDFIQTDAAINPGNSGGPLVNMRGELIGINTAIATSGMARGYMGVGFAIPTETIQLVLPDLKEGREIVRGYLGVAIKGLDAEPGLARTFGLKEDRGVLVQDVKPGSPGAKAGLKAEDVILSIGDTKIESATQLRTMVAQTKPGKKLDLVVWRDNKQITIPVEIEVQPEDFYTKRDWGRGGRTEEAEDSSGEVEIESVGMTVAKMTPELAKENGWEYDEVKGQIIVTAVEPLGEAGALRISPGDIIVSVQGEAVKTPKALEQALSREALAKGVRLRVRSEYGTRSMLLQVSP
jgi:serine protease Do